MCTSKHMFGGIVARCGGCAERTPADSDRADRLKPNVVFSKRDSYQRREHLTVCKVESYRLTLPRTRNQPRSRVRIDDTSRKRPPMLTTLFGLAVSILECPPRRFTSKSVAVAVNRQELLAHLVGGAHTMPSSADADDGGSGSLAPHEALVAAAAASVIVEAAVSPSRSDFGEKNENRQFPRSVSCQNTSQPTRSTCFSDPPASAGRNVSTYNLRRHPPAAIQHFTSRGAPARPVRLPRTLRGPNRGSNLTGGSLARRAGVEQARMQLVRSEYPTHTP